VPPQSRESAIKILNVFGMDIDVVCGTSFRWACPEAGDKKRASITVLVSMGEKVQEWTLRLQLSTAEKDFVRFCQSVSTGAYSLWVIQASRNFPNEESKDSPIHFLLFLVRERLMSPVVSDLMDLQHNSTSSSSVASSVGPLDVLIACVTPLGSAFKYRARGSDFVDFFIIGALFELLATNEEEILVCDCFNFQVPIARIGFSIFIQCPINSEGRCIIAIMFAKVHHVLDLTELVDASVTMIESMDFDEYPVDPFG